MPRKYAENTDVSPERSKMEIETLLKRYGADQFMSGWNGRKAMIMFRANERYIRFELQTPEPTDDRFKSKKAPHTRHMFDKATGQRRSIEVGTGNQAYEQEVRRLWRALALVVKAKLEAVAAGISSFESEFMANIVMPDQRTLAEHLLPQVATIYKTGKMRPLLPAFGETGD